MNRRTGIGWPVLAATELNTCHVQVAGGTLTLHLRPGDTCQILMDLARRYDTEVEPLIGDHEPDTWSWAPRPVRGTSDIPSEHAAGTALDFRALAHPRGVRGTFTVNQRAAIEKLIDFYEGTVAWGGHFGDPGHTGHVPDEMHWQITVPPGHPLISRIAHKVRDWPGHEEDDMPTPDEVADAVIRKLTHDQWTGDETVGGDALDHRPIAQVGLVGARAALGARDDLAELKDQVEQLAEKVDQLLAKASPSATA